MIIHKTVLILGLLVLSMAATSLAHADYYRALEAYNRGDFNTALREWRIDANQGDAAAQYNLGIMYEAGQGVAKNLITAYMWINLAASQGYDLASRGKNSIKQIMTTEQIAEAERLTQEWLEKHQ